MPVEQRERILVDFRRWQADQNTPGKPVADTMLIDERGRVVVERV
jgi:hypothetical protein